MICDWCGIKYDETLLRKEDVHTLEDFAFKPIICNSYYDKLKKDKRIKQKLRK